MTLPLARALTRRMVRSLLPGLAVSATCSCATPEEVRGIDQAIRAGKVQRVERGGWTDSAFDAPLWRELIRRQLAVRHALLKR